MYRLPECTSKKKTFTFGNAAAYVIEGHWETQFRN